MAYYFFVWTDEIEDHIAQHGVGLDEFESIVSFPVSTDISRSSNRRIAFGFADDSRKLACVYELLDDMTVLPVTAYEVE